MEKTRDISVHDDANVKGFFGQYRFLSNFHECPVYFEGMQYPSSENAYQAAKCVFVGQRSEFLEIGPAEAKKLGRIVQVRRNWEDVKFDTMRLVLVDKFTRNLNLREMLLETGKRHLEETNYWGDTYWGVCDGKGDNNLGRILMALRDYLALKPAGSSHKLF